MDDVLEGRKIVPKFVKKSVERHATHLDMVKRKEVPWIFSEEKANHILDFFPTIKIPSKEYPKGKPFILEPWQSFSTAVVYGWQHQHIDTGRWVRKYNQVLEFLPRKNGKTVRASGNVVYGLLLDAPDSAQLFCAATKLKQARLAFDPVCAILRKFKRDNPRMRSRKVLDILKNNITYFPNESTFEPLPADHDGLDGLAPYYAIIDELHAHPTDELLKVIETGMGTYEEPLLYIITTAGKHVFGSDGEWPCYGYVQRHKQVLQGIKEDESSWSMIYEPDEGDDWEDEEVWSKVNPNLGVSVYKHYLKQQYDKARTEGRSAENQFKTKNLNVWVAAGAGWLGDEEWIASGTEWDEDILDGRECWIGMDLSSYVDLTALVYLFPPTESDPKYRVRFKAFCPEEGIEKRSKRDGVPYKEWVEQGFMVATPGKSIDYSYLVKDLKEIKSRCKIKILEYDINLSHDLIENHIKPLIGSRRISEFKQNADAFNMPIRWIEAKIVEKLLDHGLNPVARWCCSNVVIDTNDKDRVKFSKKKSSEKIDLMVALAMAVGGYITDGGIDMSRFEDRGLLIV